MGTSSDILVTGSRERTSAPPGADWWAERLGAQIVPRGNYSLPTLAEMHGARLVIVLEADRAILHLPAEGIIYFYHPGMARRRINAVRKGLGDPMVDAMGLTRGARVLDCTLGRGTDAIIASFVVGPEGIVVGVESVPVLAAFSEYGLQIFDTRDPAINDALRRIEVVAADSADYLHAAVSRSFDVVYFDPLFHLPIEESSAMAPLRALADSPAPEPGVPGRGTPSGITRRGSQAAARQPAVGGPAARQDRGQPQEPPRVRRLLTSTAG